MKKNKMPSEKVQVKNDSKYTVKIGNNTYHVISKFIGTNTSSKIIYDLAVKRIIYNET